MPDGLLAAMYRDARYGVRTLLRTPVTTAYAIIVLALGVGANCAIFSIVDGLLLHPVVYPEPETLAMVWSHDSQGSLSDASAADYVDWRARSKTLSDFAAWVPTSFVLTGARPSALGLRRPREREFFSHLAGHPQTRAHVSAG